MNDGKMTAIPEAAQGLFDQANACFRAGDLEGAAAAYRRALQLDPRFAEAQFNLGCTVELLAGPAEALAHFAEAVRLRPEWCDARGNLGYALARVGRMAEAAAELQTAAALRPEDAGLRNNLGLALSELGRGGEALASFQEAIRLNPRYPEAHNNLAILFERYGRTSESIDSCLDALKLRPDYPQAHHNLACALKSQGRHHEALAHYREALRLAPDYLEARSSLLFTLCYPVAREQEVVAEHLCFDALLRFIPTPHDNDRSPDRRLRIGYVSADFRAHAVARFIEPVLRHHDRSRFRVYCYSNVQVPDEKSRELEKLADCFVNIAGVPDHTAEEMIRRDRIDILVDLSGHSAGNRLSLFARKPAPLQLTWLGYPHTTGLSAIDYRITDAVTDPPGTTDAFYAEKLFRLPRCFSCFDPPAEAPELREPPSLSGGFVTFGSFNNPAKITPETVALWAAVLQGLPGSRMLIKGYSLADAGSQARLLALFAGQGVAAERLELMGNTPSYRDHLALYHRVDIALDTFPYHGTTTTCEALWMGVPVVTLAGSTHRSRVGATLLNSLGLQDLVAQKPEGYREAALVLAQNPGRLARLRMTLRRIMAQSPLTDGAGFTRDLESAFREIWRSWADGSQGFVDHEGLGRAFLQAGRMDDALRQFLLVLRADPKASGALGGIQETLNRQMAADLGRAVQRDAVSLGAAQAPVSEQAIAETTLEETAELLLAMGFVTPAELICRYLEDRGWRSPGVSRTLAGVALAVGVPAHAARLLAAALERGDDSMGTRIRLVKAEELARHNPLAPAGERFLLIKAWGYGFWSDVNHVLGQCLLAEITGRIPVVHWGGNSLFSDDPSVNAFEQYFEPVSGYSLRDLAAGKRSCFPGKWNAANLACDTLEKTEGPGSCCSSLYAFERPEEVVVSDFHFAVNDLLPWIPEGHPLHGLSIDELYLHLFRRYLKVKPWIVAKADAFHRQRMAGKVHLALHVRGGDKGGEDPNLAQLNRLYHPEIERYLLHTPQARLFLITDDREILAGYLERYGDRVTHTGATRTGNAQGVHYQNHASRYRLAEEVIVDTLLATRCESFIGNGLSNVSCAVAQMKGWAPGHLRLLGARLDRLRQLTLYRR